MFQIQPEPWWRHSLESFATVTIPVILWLLENRRRAVKAAGEAQQKIQSELEKKHKENTDRLNHQDEKLDEILNERKYIPSHGHREMAGPLTAEGIFPPRR